MKLSCAMRWLIGAALGLVAGLLVGWSLSGEERPVSASVTFSYPRDPDASGNASYSVFVPDARLGDVFAGVLRGTEIKALTTEHGGRPDLEASLSGVCPTMIPSWQYTRYEFDGALYQEVSARVCLEANYPSEDSRYICAPREGDESPCHSLTERLYPSGE